MKDVFLHRLFMLPIGIALAAGMAHGEPAASPPVRRLLADPAMLAQWLRDHDPQTIAARDRVEQASDLADQARVLPNPELSAALGNVVFGEGTPGPPEGPTGFTQTSNVAVGVSELFEIGKRGPRRQAADLRTREAGELAVASLGGRVNDATGTLGKLAYLAARRGLVAQNLAAARTLQNNELVRFQKNDLSGIDYNRIELDTEALEIELSRADADLAVAIATCSATLFAPCSGEGLDSNVLDTAAPLPAMLPGVDDAIQQRAAHVAQRLESSALDEDASLASARAIPDPTLGVTYTYDNYTFGGSIPQTFAFSVGIPLTFFDTGRHDAAAARANAQAVAAQDQATMRGERGAAESYAIQLITLRQTLDRLEKESVPKAQNIVEGTRKAFDLGQSGLADLLLAERQYRDLEAQELETRFDLFNVRVQLRQVLGLDDAVARSIGGTR